MNANIIKMPLIRVAHPSQQECEQELNKVERLLQNAKSSKNDSQQELSLGPDDNDVVTLQAHGKRQAKDEIIAGAPRIQHPPSLFNFEHHFDKELNISIERGGMYKIARTPSDIQEVVCDRPRVLGYLLGENYVETVGLDGAREMCISEMSVAQP